MFSKQGYLDLYPENSIHGVKADVAVVQNARTFIVGNAPSSATWMAGDFQTLVRRGQGDVDGCEQCRFLAGRHSAGAGDHALQHSVRQALEAEKRPVDFRQSTVGALEA